MRIIAHERRAQIDPIARKYFAPHAQRAFQKIYAAARHLSHPSVLTDESLNRAQRIFNRRNAFGLRHHFAHTRRNIGAGAEGGFHGSGKLRRMRGRQRDHGHAIGQTARRAAASPTAVCGSICISKRFRTSRIVSCVWASSTRAASNRADISATSSSAISNRPSRASASIKPLTRAHRGASIQTIASQNCSIPECPCWGLRSQSPLQFRKFRLCMTRARISFTLVAIISRATEDPFARRHIRQKCRRNCRLAPKIRRAYQGCQAVRQR